MCLSDSYDEQYANLRESIELNERILADCTDNQIRFSALQMLVYAYSMSRFPCANEEKAVHYAEEDPRYDFVRQEALFLALFQ